MGHLLAVDDDYLLTQGEAGRRKVDSVCVFVRRSRRDLESVLLLSLFVCKAGACKCVVHTLRFTESQEFMMGQLDCLSPAGSRIRKVRWQ